MLISIQHSLRYDYDRPVTLDPLTLRLTPRQDTTQRLINHTISVMPTPEGQAWAIEQAGTSARTLWFSGQHRTLTIAVSSTVQTLRSNPFDAIITHAPARTLPVAYPEPVLHQLAPYLAACDSPEGLSAVRDWSNALADQASHETLSFLTRLTQQIHADFHIINRPTGDPFPPAQTLEQRTGACRDVAILFIAACRCHGIAARFVSGYSLHHPPETTEHELHAWAEAYLPGTGWRGYDPSLGLAAADGHIPLASAPDHRLAAPTTGTFRSLGFAESTLTYNIQISAADPAQS